MIKFQRLLVMVYLLTFFGTEFLLTVCRPVSPYGLPMLATWLLAKLHVLRYAIQDRIYG